jgi:hypothetical protein
MILCVSSSWVFMKSVYLIILIIINFNEYKNMIRPLSQVDNTKENK